MNFKLQKLGQKQAKTRPKTRPKPDQNKAKTIQNISVYFLKRGIAGLYKKEFDSAAGNTMKSQFSLMGYGINKKFLCKLDPEQYSNGYGYEYM